MAELERAGEKIEHWVKSISARITFLSMGRAPVRETACAWGIPHPTQEIRAFNEVCMPAP